jgi:hypothetical protein
MSETTLGLFEKLDYSAPGWNHIYNNNIWKMENLHFRLLTLRNFRKFKAPDGSGSYVLKQADTAYVDPVKIRGQGI